MKNGLNQNKTLKDLDSPIKSSTKCMASEHFRTNGEVIQVRAPVHLEASGSSLTIGIKSTWSFIFWKWFHRPRLSPQPRERKILEIDGSDTWPESEKSTIQFGIHPSNHLQNAWFQNKW